MTSLLDKKVDKNIFLGIGAFAYLILILITLFHRQPPLFDEVLFIPNVLLFEKHGLSKEFLVNIHNQAPGPLYQFVHYFLKPITDLETPGIRLVNVFLLGMIILLVSKIISLTQSRSYKDSLVYGVGILSIPMVWQVSGMALTEIPSMFFATLSILLIVLSLKNEDNSLTKALMLALLGGLSLGLSILGRSPFLLVAFSALVLILPAVRMWKRWCIVLLYSICALSICIPVFIIWNGLVPPQQAFVGAGGIEPWHGILSFAYGALLVFFISPKWFYFNSKILGGLIFSYLALFILNFFTLEYKYYPLSEVLEKIFPSSAMEIYPFLISPLLATLALYFVICSGFHCWKKRYDPIFVFILLCGGLVLLTTFKVTHLFSSRYVAQAAPFFILLSPDFETFNLSKIVRFLIGLTIGFLSLETYFLFQ